jgi:hypothetical protein
MRENSDDYFELDGRRIRVSLVAFADIGSGGTPRGMIGCRVRPAVHGVIGERADDDTEVWGRAVARRASRLHWLVLVVPTCALVAAAGSWLWLRSPPAREVVTRESSSLTVEPARVEVPYAEPETAIAVLGSKAATARPSPPAAEPHESGCAQHRALADAARHAGDWTALERLARARSSCWPRASVALGLQMRALFELDRYRECLELGSKSKSKSREVEQWSNNCERALR